MSKTPRRGKIAAIIWSVIGILCLIQYGYYLVTTPGAFDKMLSTPLVNSIAVLFIISIAANVHAAMSENDDDEDD